MTQTDGFCVKTMCLVCFVSRVWLWFTGLWVWVVCWRVASWASRLAAHLPQIHNTSLNTPLLWSHIMYSVIMNTRVEYLMLRGIFGLLTCS